MVLEINSLKVLLFVDGLPEDFHNFSKKEIMAIMEAIKDLWPKNMFERYWFDVEIDLHEKEGDRWSFGVHVVCYQMPDKSRRFMIPRVMIDQVIDRLIQIDPVMLDINPNYGRRLNDFRRYKIEVMHVYE